MQIAKREDPKKAGPVRIQRGSNPKQRTQSKPGQVGIGQVRLCWVRISYIGWVGGIFKLIFGIFVAIDSLQIGFPLFLGILQRVSFVSFGFGSSLDESLFLGPHFLGPIYWAPSYPKSSKALSLFNKLWNKLGIIYYIMDLFLLISKQLQQTNACLGVLNSRDFRFCQQKGRQAILG